MNNSRDKIWRLISDPPRSGVDNMAIDEWFLHGLELCGEPQTILRFYEWERPTLSLGQHQKIERAADPDFCRSHGIEIVHRPTGGRAVLHDRELTYAIVSNDREIFNAASVLGTYRQVACGLCRGLKRIGVEAMLADSPMHALEAPENPLTVKHPCFSSPSRYELMVGERKLIGSAQKRLRRSFLQHGSLLQDCDIPVLARATRASELVLSQKITSLKSILGHSVSRSELEAALADGLAEEFSVSFFHQALTEDELAASSRDRDVVLERV